MSTSALISLGMRAMFANQAALQTIGQNISNANTVGYSRQSVTLTTPDGQYTGAGFFGKGVSVETVVRSHNEFLTKEAATSKAAAAMDATAYAQLQQLENVFPTGEQGLGQAVNQFFNAMVDVSSKPSDTSARQVVLGRAQELAARFQNAGQQLTDLQTGVVSDLKASIDVVNQIANQIATANNEIARVSGSGHTPNDLLDKRDQLVSKLSDYVRVTTLPASDGTMGVFIGGGQRLVLGGIAEQLTLTPDPYDTSRVQIALANPNGDAQVLDENVLNGGSLSALVAFQNVDLQDARNLVGQMAQALGAAVNEQQSLGLDLTDPPSAGKPIFSYGLARALPADTNARDASGALATNVGITVTNAALVPAKSFVLRADPSGAAGMYKLTTRPGAQSEVMDATQIEAKYGLKLDFSGAPLAQGDSFLLEPVAGAAVEMKRVLDAPTGIAAASPITGYTAAGNTGSATLASLSVVNSQFDASKQPISVTFGTVDNSDPARPGVNYTAALSDGTTVTGVWRAGEEIGNFPLSGIDLGFRMKLNGVPKENDVISTQTTQFPATNNGNAQAFLAMQTQSIIGRVLSTDASGNNTVTGGTSVTDAYAAAMSDIGSRVQGANYLSQVSTSVSQDAEATRSGMAGVNLDEEAARLMQFQQSYQAAAKLLQAGQTIFDELLKLAGN